MHVLKSRLPSAIEKQKNRAASDTEDEDENAADDSIDEHARYLSAAASPDRGGGESGDGNDEVSSGEIELYLRAASPTPCTPTRWPSSFSKRIKGLGTEILH